jgi:hypothetical protein
MGRLMAGGGLRYFRCNPLRCSKMASMPFLSCKFFATQKTYEINVAGILPARLRRQTASLPAFTLGVLRSKTPKTKTLKRFGSASMPAFIRKSGAFSRRIRTCFS